jgi:hypothetical protein
MCLLAEHVRLVVSQLPFAMASAEGITLVAKFALMIASIFA